MLLFARHGRTPANAQGLLQGRMDLSLDDVGRAQAQQIAQALSHVDVVIASPLRRAVETAEAFGRTIEIDPRWIELDFGEFDGKRREDLPAEVWDQLRSDIHFTPPRGESLAQLMERVAPALAEVLERSRDQHIVVVSHVVPIKAVLACVLGVDIGVSWRCHLDQASISRMAMTTTGPVMHSFNETSHLVGAI
jgi:alpha-ribazole phosphatase